MTKPEHPANLQTHLPDSEITWTNPRTPPSSTGCIPSHIKQEADEDASARIQNCLSDTNDHYSENSVYFSKKCRQDMQDRSPGTHNASDTTTGQLTTSSWKSEDYQESWSVFPEPENPTDVKQERHECKLEVEDPVLSKQVPALDQWRMRCNENVNFTRARSSNCEGDEEAGACSVTQDSKSAGPPAELHQCPECDYVSKSKYRLGSHVVAKHDANARLYQCSRCDYASKVKRYFKQHRCKHDAAPKYHACQLCDYTTKWKQSLSLHVRLKHDSGVAVLQCSGCAYSTKSRKSLAAHFTLRHDSDADVYGCARCPYTTKSRRSLGAHFRLKHDSSVQTFQCSRCDYATKRRKYLLLHFRVRHDAGADVYRCTQCDYATKWRTYLPTHVMAKHNPDGPTFGCERCDYTTKVEQHLAAHVRVRHGDARRFRCTRCDYVTRYKFDLAKHCRRRHVDLQQS